MPLDTRIALGVQPLQLADPLAREGQVQNILASQAQQRAAGTQQQHSQLQIDQMQRQIQQDENYVSQMKDAIEKNGGPPDLMQAFRIMATNKNPQISQHGVTGLQSLQRLADAKKAGIYGEVAPAVAAPTMPAAAAPGALGLGTYGMDQNVPMFNQPNVPPLNLAKPTVAPAPAPVMNQLMPPPAAPVNQLAAAPQANAAKALETEYMKLSQYSDLPGVKDRMTLIAEKIKHLSTPDVSTMQALGYPLTTEGYAQFNADKTRNAAPAILTKYQDARAALIASGAPPDDPRVRELNAMILKETTHAPAASMQVNVSQSTEKKYGEAFGGKIADRDVALLDTATRAPELASNANRVLSILSQGNVFTGSAADIKLNMARALNLAGAGNDEKIANTEMLVSGLARQTLGAVKSSGLGAGQGFTDKDLQFLQDAEGGRITLNAQTIQRLAELSHTAADKSAATWNKRVKEIPKSATEGTGLSTEPVVIPKRFGAAAAPTTPAVGTKAEGYRFKGGDPAVAANWEKL